MNSFRSQNQICTTLYGWPHRQTLGKRPENRCPTNDGQHSCRRSWETFSFWCLCSFSFCHRRMRKPDLKLILPSLSSWPDLTTIKRRRDRRKLFHSGDTISALMSSSENKSLHVVVLVRWRCWRCSCRPHLQQSYHGENDSTLLSQCRRRGGDKFPKPKNLAWRDPNPKDSIY